ncbi:MAG: hypothetical protein LUC45_05430 [Paraprevotella sp.]|nr:hypothetical protein [Paraprevotella sp.]
MSIKKENRRAKREAREEKQRSHAIKSLMWAVAVLVVLGIIAFAIMGNEF